MALTEIKSETSHYFKDEDGKYQGEYKRWHSNGQLQEHCFFKDSKRHGEYKWWYRNGKLQEHSFCKDAEYHGEYKWWNDNGQLREHCFHNNDKEVINFIAYPEQYPTSKEDKTVFALKYGSGTWL